MRGLSPVSLVVSLRSGLRIAVGSLVLLLLSGCGEGGEESSEQRPLPGQVSLDETAFECLTEVGVQLAIAPGNLAFYKEAKAAGDVVEIGEEHDHRDEVVVRLLASKRGGPKEWMLWYSQPPSSSETPESIVDNRVDPSTMGFSPATDPYVAFKVKPKYVFRKEIHRCVEFPLDAG